MGTYQAKNNEIAQKWHVVDLEDKVLGRAATVIATVLRGKNKVTFTPHVDTGDFVVVINAQKVKLTGNKMEQKRYYRYSGYPGGMKSFGVAEALTKNPDLVVREAVKGMLPHNTLGRNLLKKLKVYSGAEHPHSAQQPQELKVK